MANDRSIPLAILGAGLLIGGGLYFGLASSAESPAPAPQPTQAAASGTPLPPAPLPPQPTSIPTAAGNGAADAKAAAEKALEALKKEVLVDRCWKPAIKANPNPPTSKHTIDVTFGPDGKQIARGVNDIREQSRNDVSQCLSNTPDALVLAPAPGQNVRAELTLTFP